MDIDRDANPIDDRCTGSPMFISAFSLLAFPRVFYNLLPGFQWTMLKLSPR